MRERLEKTRYAVDKKSYRSFPATPATSTEWPSNSNATRSLRQKTWTVVLRCRSCRQRFAVRGIPIDRLALAPQVTHCTFCGAQPRLSPDGSDAMVLHLIIDIREEAEK